MMMLNRRGMIAGLGGIGLAALAGCGRAGGETSADNLLREGLAALEEQSSGKLGVAVLDCADGALAGHRLDERFTMCSTFKLPLAALILTKIDAGDIAADATLPISRAYPVGHAPVVQARLDAGATAMSILDLCEAVQTQSDNGAANILLRAMGGPQSLTTFFRSLGDNASRLDRYEPDLNTSHDGDPRDTTTPGAMAESLRAILTGALLKPASRTRLIDWTIATQTGLKRLRGGLPAGWRAGDKTGTYPGDGSFAGKANDVAICWRPERAEPFIIAAFLETAANSPPADADAVIAQAARIASHWIAGRG
jgi:beta-lactamase class A